MKMAAQLLSLFMWIYAMLSVIAFVFYYLIFAVPLFYNKQVKKLLYFTASGILITLQLFAVIYASLHIHIVKKADIALSELSQSTS